MTLTLLTFWNVGAGLLALLMFLPKLFLLLLEVAEETRAFAKQLFRRELTTLEVLHLLIGHIPSTLALRKRLLQLVHFHLPKLLLLQRQAIPQLGLIEPVIRRALSNSGRKNKVQTVHFCLDLREEPLEVLRHHHRGASCLG